MKVCFRLLKQRFQVIGHCYRLLTTHIRAIGNMELIFDECIKYLESVTEKPAVSASFICWRIFEKYILFNGDSLFYLDYYVGPSCTRSIGWDERFMGDSLQRVQCATVRQLRPRRSAVLHKPLEVWGHCREADRRRQPSQTPRRDETSSVAVFDRLLRRCPR